MSYLFIALASVCLWMGQLTIVYSQTSQPTQHKIELNYDSVLDATSALLRFRIADNIDRYHSLDLSAFYIYSGKTQTTRPKVDVELFTVVKARKLNSDLYVVFLIDGKEVHFSSNRSAIRNPVRGRRWIGERMVFSLPLEEFKKLATAEKLGIRMGSVKFDLDQAARSSLKLFAGEIKRIGP